MGDEPEENREHDADDKAGHDRKVEGAVFAAVHDVAGESSQPKGEFAPEVEKSADHNEDRAKEKKRAAEFAERIHKAILPERPEHVSVALKLLLFNTYT